MKRKRKYIFFEFMEEATCLDTIVFNRCYTKVHEQSIAILLTKTELEISKKTYLNKDYNEFVRYDTDPVYSTFDEGKYLHLCFLGDKGIPFTILIENNAENRNKYIVNEFYKIRYEE